MKWIGKSLILILLFAATAWGQANTLGLGVQTQLNTLAPIQIITPEEFKNSPQFPQLQIEPKRLDDVLKSIQQNDPQKMQQQLKEGGWLGSGGGGEKCGDSVLTLEYAENLKEVRSFILPRNGEVPLQYLDRVLTEKIEPYSPFLVFRLRQAIQIVTQNPWVAVPNMPWLGDTGEILHDVLSGCQPLQFITRIAHQNTGERSRVFILVNQNAMALLRKQHSHALAVMSEAFLILHEALYTLGVELSQQDSQNTRVMTALLLSEDLYDVLRTASNPYEGFSGLLAAMAKSGFGRLFNLIYSDDKNLATNARISESDLQRIRSYKGILDNMYAIVSVANGKLAAEMSSSELRKLSKKLERYLIEEATDEECFIAAGIEATKMGLIPAVDILMVPGHNPSFDTSTCLYIQPMRFSSPILGKASRYCQLQQLVR